MVYSAMIQPDKMHATLLGSLLKINNQKLIEKLPYFLPSSLEGTRNQTIPGRLSLASQRPDFLGSEDCMSYD